MPDHPVSPASASAPAPSVPAAPAVPADAASFCAEPGAEPGDLEGETFAPRGAWYRRIPKPVRRFLAMTGVSLLFSPILNAPALLLAGLLSASATRAILGMTVDGAWRKLLFTALFLGATPLCWQLLRGLRGLIKRRSRGRARAVARFLFYAYILLCYALPSYWLAGKLFPARPLLALLPALALGGCGFAWYCLKLGVRPLEARRDREKVSIPRDTVEKSDANT